MIHGISLIDTFHPLTNARLKAAVAAGVAVPSRKYLHAESQFYRDISSQLANIEFCYCFLSDVKAYGFRSLVNVNIHVAVEVGTVTQTNFRGVGVSAASSYLSIGAPSSWLGNFGNANNSMGYYVVEKGTAVANIYPMGGRASDNAAFRFIYNPITPQHGYTNSNSTNNLTGTLSMSNNTTYSMDRLSSAVNFKINGSTFISASNAASGAAMDAPQFLLNVRKPGAAPNYEAGIPADMLIGFGYAGNGSLDNTIMHNAFHKMYLALQ